MIADRIAERKASFEEAGSSNNVIISQTPMFGKKEGKL